MHAIKEFKYLQYLLITSFISISAVVSWHKDVSLKWKVCIIHSNMDLYGMKVCCTLNVGSTSFVCINWAHKNLVFKQICYEFFDLKPVRVTSNIIALLDICIMKITFSFLLNKIYIQYWKSDIVCLFYFILAYLFIMKSYIGVHKYRTRL